MTDNTRCVRCGSARRRGVLHEQGARVHCRRVPGAAASPSSGRRGPGNLALSVTANGGNPSLALALREDEASVLSHALLALLCVGALAPGEALAWACRDFKARHAPHKTRLPQLVGDV